MVHQVTTILSRKESDVTCLVTEVEDLILEDENLESKPKWIILHWFSHLIIHPKPINRVRGRYPNDSKLLFFMDDDSKGVLQISSSIPKRFRVGSS